MIVAVYLFLVFLGFSSSSHIHFRKPRQTESINMVNQDAPKEQQNGFITGMENTFIFSNSKSLKIEDFQIGENNSLDCYNDEIEIKFFVEKLAVYGYLSHNLNAGNIVKEKNTKFSQSCKVIRRYKII